MTRRHIELEDCHHGRHRVSAHPVTPCSGRLGSRGGSAMIRATAHPSASPSCSTRPTAAAGTTGASTWIADLDVPRRAHAAGSARSSGPSQTSEFRAGLRALLMATIEREGIGATRGREGGPRPRARRPGRQDPGRSDRSPGPVPAAPGPPSLPASPPARSPSPGSRSPAPTRSRRRAVPVKRSSERAQLALAGSDAEPGPAAPGVRAQPAGRGDPGRAGALRLTSSPTWTPRLSPECRLLCRRPRCSAATARP